MSNTVQVAYPHKGEKLHWAWSPGFFVAFGKALPEVNGVNGVLRDKNNQPIGTPTTLQFNKNSGAESEWIIEFNNVPFNVPFSLYILDDAAAKELASVDDLKLEPTAAPDSNPTITTPAQNSTICTSFGAAGHCEFSLASASMSGTAGNKSGTIVNAGPPNWVASFSSVPAGSGYTLTAKDGQNQIGTATGLTTSLSACGGG